MVNTDKFTFYSSTNYYNALANKIAKTKKGDRVALATMSFQPEEPLIKNILNELYAAASRGVSVDIMIDAFAFIIKDGILPGPLLFMPELPKHLTKTFKSRLYALEMLQKYGGRYSIINRPPRPFMPPFSGRSHLKFAVVNNHVFIGGCNLVKASNLDLMVGWEDINIANWLCNLENHVSQNGHVVKGLGKKDMSTQIDKTTNLLLDVGIANQSLIFDKALELIDTAKKHIYITCQYFPNDITIRRLAAASARGVNVTIVYNHPGKHLFPLNLLHHSVVWSEKLGRSHQLFSNQLPKKHNFLHAKLLVTDQGTVIGSHNFVHAGVAFGTAEIAMLSTDKHFGESAIEAFKKLLLPNGQNL